MAIGLDMWNLIIHRDAMERHFPGGFQGYCEKYAEEIDEGIVVWFDDDLVREGAMSGDDIQQMITTYENMGFEVCEKGSDGIVSR